MQLNTADLIKEAQAKQDNLSQKALEANQEQMDKTAAINANIARNQQILQAATEDKTAASVEKAAVGEVKAGIESDTAKSLTDLNALREANEAVVNAGDLVFQATAQAKEAMEGATPLGLMLDDIAGQFGYQTDRAKARQELSQAKEVFASTKTVQDEISQNYNHGIIAAGDEARLAVGKQIANAVREEVIAAGKANEATVAINAQTSARQSLATLSNIKQEQLKLLSDRIANEVANRESLVRYSIQQENRRFAKEDRERRIKDVTTNKEAKREAVQRRHWKNVIGDLYKRTAVAQKEVANITGKLSSYGDKGIDTSEFAPAAATYAESQLAYSDVSEQLSNAIMQGSELEGEEYANYAKTALEPLYGKYSTALGTMQTSRTAYRQAEMGIITREATKASEFAAARLAQMNEVSKALGSSAVYTSWAQVEGVIKSLPAKSRVTVYSLLGKVDNGKSLVEDLITEVGGDIPAFKEAISDITNLFSGSTNFLLKESSPVLAAYDSVAADVAASSKLTTITNQKERKAAVAHTAKATFLNAGYNMFTAKGTGTAADEQVRISLADLSDEVTKDIPLAVTLRDAVNLSKYKHVTTDSIFDSIDSHVQGLTEKGMPKARALSQVIVDMSSLLEKLYMTKPARDLDLMSEAPVVALDGVKLGDKKGRLINIAKASDLLEYYLKLKSEGSSLNSFVGVVDLPKMQDAAAARTVQTKGLLDSTPTSINKE